MAHKGRSWYIRKNNTAVGAKKGGLLIGMNDTSKDSAPLIDAYLFSILTGFHNWRQMVKNQSQNNMNTQKIYSLLLGDTIFEVVKGETEFKGGVIGARWPPVLLHDHSLFQ